MNEPAPFPKQTDELKLRARPRPVTRINRKVLMAGACLGVLGLFAAASIALDPPKAVDPADRQELYNTATKRAPDGLADLPNSYLNWQPAGDTPKLGAPMAGDLGGTMRLGAYDAVLKDDSKVAEIYGTTRIEERHRHRYEVDLRFQKALEEKGLIFSGMSPDGRLPEIVEVEDHPWYIGVQFHPESIASEHGHKLLQNFTDLLKVPA